MRRANLSAFLTLAFWLSVFSATSQKEGKGMWNVRSVVVSRMAMAFMLLGFTWFPAASFALTFEITNLTEDSDLNFTLNSLNSSGTVGASVQSTGGAGVGAYQFLGNQV